MAQMYAHKRSHNYSLPLGDHNTVEEATDFLYEVVKNEDIHGWAISNDFDELLESGEVYISLNPIH